MTPPFGEFTTHIPLITTQDSWLIGFVDQLYKMIGQVDLEQEIDETLNSGLSEAVIDCAPFMGTAVGLKRVHFFSKKCRKSRNSTQCLGIKIEIFNDKKL